MATYYFRNTGDVNWGTASNWSLTDGGGATGAVPTSADDAYFTSNSGNCTINASARVCKTLIFSGVGAGNYAGTLTLTNGITIYGNITLSATMTISGTGLIGTAANATLTSNGKIFPNNLVFSTPSTITFADNWEIGGTLQKVLTISVTINGNQIKVGGGLNVGTGGGGYFLGGTTNIIMNGTGTWQGTEEIRSNLEFNTSGTITISGNVRFRTAKTLKYTSGTLITSGSTLSILGGCTIDLQSQTIGGLSAEDTSTTTFSSDVYLSGALSIGITQSPIFNGSKIYVGGNFSAGTGSGYFTTGTTEIVLNGTGTWTGGDTRNTLTINTTGTITLSGNIAYGVSGRTLTFTAGTINPSTSTFTTAAGLTYAISSSGFTLWNWSALTGTHTINTGTITANNNLTLNGNTTFAGTGGWTAANLTDTTAGRILTLKDGSTYRITSALSLTGTNASRWSITSSSATLKANFILNQGATQNLIYVNGTRADSSAGQTIYSVGGTLTDTINWNNGTRPNPFNTIRIS